MRISYKLFIAMSSTAVMALLLMLGFTKWTMQQGFVEYLNALDEANYAATVDKLRSHYKANGGWYLLQDQPHLWNQITDDRPAVRINRPEHGRRRPRRERDDWPAEKPPNNRLTLYDVNRHKVIGPDPRDKEVVFLAIDVEGETVGWLGLASRRELEAAADLSFIEQQSRKFVVFGLSLLFVSVVVSSILARHFTKPIRALAWTSKRLSEGDLKARTRVKGNDEISQLTRDFNSMAESLVSSLERRQQLLADVAHELRTPLSILRGEIEAIEDGVRELGPGTLASIQQEVRRLTRMVDDLHQLAQWDNASTHLDMEPLDPIQLTRRRMHRMAANFASANLDLIDELPDNVMGLVEGDESRLGQVLDNLLDNSLRYTDAGGLVRITAQWKDDQFLLMIDDSAPAVSNREASKIFERLYRVEPSRSRKYGGSGLGLAICRSIIEAHNGRIWAKPSLLGGLKILLTLPVKGSAP